MIQRFAAITTLFAGTVFADWPSVSYTEASKEDYASWGALFGEHDGQYSGYAWKPYTVTTEDGWELTMFQIIASQERRDKRIVQQKYLSVLMMHGQGQDAETWLTGYFVGTPLPLKLVDQGYIVYMGNNRGTKFSDNTLVKSKASEAYWNFDFTDMGESDLPAFLHTIKEFDTVNEIEFDTVNKIKYIGYDVGNMQLMYALTQLEDFYLGDQVDNFIALSPCIYRTIGEDNTPVPYRTGIGAYRALGVYAINGPNWAADLAKICEFLDQYACKEAQMLAEPGVPISVKTLEYQKQMDDTQRYQQYASSANFWKSAEQPLIEAAALKDYEPVKPISTDETEKTEEATDVEPVSPLASIDTVRIFLHVANGDKTCTPEQAQLINDLVPSVQSMKIYENADHDFFTWSNQMKFMESLIANLAA